MHNSGALNRIFRVIWNASTGTWQAVSELAKGAGKSSGSAGGGCPALNTRLTGLLQALSAAGLAGLIAGAASAAGLPTGGQVVAGSATISQSGNTLTINQSSAKLATDWQSFSIGAGQAVNFVQPSSSAVALNRVLGSDVSRIQGALTANGQVFLLNPNGVLFTPTAQVNVGGLVASTLNLSNADFLAGRYKFEGDSTQAVVNQGQITASGGGAIALIAAKISNSGTLQADGGQVLLGAGRRVTLDLGGKVKLEVDEGALNALIDNGGAIRANGGLVLLTAKAAGDLGATVINHSGVIEAQTLASGEKGQILLLGDLAHDAISVGGRLDASAPLGGDGGFIETSAAKVKFQDSLAVTTKAAQGKTGRWLIDPNDFTIAASGGDITGAQLSSQLGNSTVFIETASQGTAGGHGDIIVSDAVSWNADTMLALISERDIHINAPITAQHAIGNVALYYGQGSNNGGYTSSIQYGAAGKINLQAGNNYFTKAGSEAEQTWTVLTSIEALQSLPGDADQRVVLGDNIDARDTANWNGGAGFMPLAIYAAGLQFDGLGHSISGLTINRPDDVYIGLFGGSNGARISNLKLLDVNIRGFNTVGALVGQASNNTTINNVSVTGSVRGHDTVGGLVGWTFDGSVSNASSAVTVLGNSFVGGLLGGGGNGVTLRHVQASGAVTGTLDTVGGLIGGTFGATFNDAHASGAVTGGTKVGGLVGSFSGTMTNATASGIVSSTGESVGGLIGYAGTSTLSDAHASGAVTGGTMVGGLVGSFSGTVTNATASGSVSSTGESVGGLIGYADTTAVADSTATGPVSGGTKVGGLIGWAWAGSITHSHAEGNVSGSSQVGGLVGNSLGYDGSAYSVSNSSARGAVVAGNGGIAGGLIGDAEDTNIRASLASGHVTAGTGGKAGGLVGRIVSTGESGSIAITSSQASGEVSVGAGPVSDEDAAVAGGLVGKASGITVTEANASGPVRGGVNAQVGGLVGSDTNGSYRSVSASGNVQGGDNSMAGGLIGLAISSSIANSHASGAVTVAGPGADDGNQGIALFAGGLVGGQVVGSISQSYATGAVTGGDLVNAGGLVGFSSNAVISQSYASGNVSGGQEAPLGGLVGYMLDSAIDNSHASGNLSTTGSRVGIIGGLVGIFSGPISNSFASGQVPAGAGGLVGGNGQQGTVTKSFWNTETSGATLSGGGEGKTTAEMTDIALYQNAGWRIVSNSELSGSNAYPRLIMGESGPEWHIKPSVLSLSYTLAPLSGSNYVYSGNRFTLGDLWSSRSIFGSNYSSWVAGTDYTFQFNGSTVTGFTNAGVYTGLSVTILKSGFTVAASGNTNGSFSIAKAPLSVTANNSNKVYGNAVPALGGVISGFVNGESAGTAAGFGGQASYTSSAGSNTGVGTVAITAGVGSLVADNYDFSNVVNGTLTITPRPITVTANTQSKVYGNVDPALSYAVTAGNLVNGDSLSGALSRAPGSNVGSYSIDASALANGNYLVTANNGTLSITPRPITVTADALSKVYGNVDPTLSYAVTAGNLVGDDKLSGALSRAPGSNVGSYTIDASALANGNYLVTAKNGTLSIAPRPVTVTADDQSMIAGRVDPALSYQAEKPSASRGLLAGESLVGALARVDGVAPGSYAIEQGSLNQALNPNYVLSYIGGVFKIEPAVNPPLDSALTNAQVAVAGALNGRPVTGVQIADASPQSLGGQTSLLASAQGSGMIISSASPAAANQPFLGQSQGLKFVEPLSDAPAKGAATGEALIDNSAAAAKPVIAGVTGGQGGVDPMGFMRVFVVGGGILLPGSTPVGAGVRSAPLDAPQSPAADVRNPSDPSNTGDTNSTSEKKSVSNKQQG